MIKRRCNIVTKLKNCTYKHCRCQSKEIPIGTEIEVGSRYYHPQCFNESENIKEIKQLYFDNISNTVVQGMLGKIINDIIYGKNVDSEYFLFAIKFAINKKIKINNPCGLHYIIDNKQIKDEWSKIQTSKIRQSIKIEDMPKQAEVNFECKNIPRSGFSSILKG